MAKHLVIVESPAKSKTVGKILGPDYNVMPSVGHIRDLPEHSLGIDASDNFRIRYEVSDDKKKVVADLKKAAKAADAIYLAPDPDREGEAIAWHLKEVLEPAAPGKKFLRVQYNEVTPRAVKAAFAAPGEINMNRVNAQQARRVIDRYVGFDVSHILWRRLNEGRGLSAGRVQSVALRLVCERERAIQEFQPVPYWILGAVLRKQTGDTTPFSVKLSKIDGKVAKVTSEEQAKAILADLEPRSMRVAEIRTKEVERHALPPFITSSLQQAASSVLGFSPSRTMGIAQKLYEGVDLGAGQGSIGLITYMRTDAPAVSQDARAAARDFITQRYGASFYPDKPNFYKSRGDAQEAHEAIRPTDVTRTPDSLAGVLEPADLKLYDLIWRRFVASQMANARIGQHTAAVEAVPTAAQTAAGAPATSYEFTATASEVTFEGFLKVMRLDIRKSLVKDKPADAENADEGDDVERLPDLAAGEPLDRERWISDRKETKPPARYSEASLIRAMEENGVGRPSTYAAIISTLEKRKYVANERRTLSPTPLGFKVNDFLCENLPSLFDVGFTASMESDLDKVEDGGEDWLQLIGTFYGKFKSATSGLKQAEEADTSKVSQLVALFDTVSEWAPATKRGKRVFDDKKFVHSIKEQFEKGEKAISQRQLESIARIALRYASQIPDVEGRVAALGLADAAQPPDKAESAPDNMEKLDLLLGLAGLSEGDRKFLSSLKEQAEGGRALSPRQVFVLNRALLSNAPLIPDAENVLAKFGIAAKPADLAPDTESPALVAAVAKITEFREAVKRGKRVFDDKEFVDSVTRQLKEKGALSPRQRAALHKLIARYRSQIPEADQLVGPAKAKGAKAAAAKE